MIRGGPDRDRPKTAILGPQFCRILVLGPHFWWSGGGAGPPWIRPCRSTGFGDIIQLFIAGVHIQEAARFQQALETGGIEWLSGVPGRGTTITERFLHAAVYFDKSIYVFGGCTATSTTFNDLWRFDLASREWVRPLATGEINVCPLIVNRIDRLCGQGHEIQVIPNQKSDQGWGGCWWWWWWWYG